MTYHLCIIGNWWLCVDSCLISSVLTGGYAAGYYSYKVIFLFVSWSFLKVLI